MTTTTATSQSLNPWLLLLVVASSCCLFCATALSVESPPQPKKPPTFVNPLLTYGYRPTVEEYENNNNNNLQVLQKPLLIYLPGFDGSFLSPCLQFPELATTWDVQCLTVTDSDDRTTFSQLVTLVLDFISQQKENRDIYLTGESFGSLLALQVARQVPNNRIAGLTLINPATSYPRSKLAQRGTPLTTTNSLWYWVRLGPTLGPLLVDPYSWQQLLTVLGGECLPSVIDTAAREAYMGRVAFSLPSTLPVMTQGCLRWRLKEWLTEGSNVVLGNDDDKLDLPSLPTLIVCGQLDETLPSVEEGEKLQRIMKDAHLHMVDGAGHGSTCLYRVDLAALMRNRFPKLTKGGRTSMKPVAQQGEGKYFGMEPRYDGKHIGMFPFRYWLPEYYKKVTPS